MPDSDKSLWNPAFMSNAQQQQLQLQQAAAAAAANNGAPYGFRNPWHETGASKRNSLAFAHQQQQVLPTTYEDEVASRARGDRRRNSSLVIPPPRAAGPAPDAYSASHHRFLPPQGYPSYAQDMHRRQSVAVAPQHAFAHPSTTANTAAASAAAAAAAAASASAMSDSPFHAPMSPFHRKLSAYNNSGSVALPLSPPMKQLRRQQEDTIPVVLPQTHRVSTRHELRPTLNATPKYRRASLNSRTVSPLVALTSSLTTTYTLCSPEFSYQTSRNPKRVLTKPSDGKHNNGNDNVNSDYILYVNDVLGTEQNRKYLVLDILGQGTFGQVVKCQNLLTKDIVAVKVVKSKSEYLNQSITEAKILELLNTKIDPRGEHHFLRMQETFVHKNHLCLVFELLSSNLYELLKQNQFHGLSISLIRTFARQLLDSLCVLKDNKLIHCDLKPENILLVSLDRPELKVIDFGSACEESRTLYTYIQSRFYRAPEVILGIPYSTGIDMWSLGCILAELFLGIPIFPGSSEFNQISRIVDTLGLPPTWMLDMGRNSCNFLVKSEDEDDKTWRVKDVDEYNLDFHTSEQPGKQYFKWNKLEDIIDNYRISKKLLGSSNLVDKEKIDRKCLTHFLKGLLDLNPLERWTPPQAAMHPFITQQPFTGEWYPPGTTPRRNEKLPILQDRSATSEINKLTIGN
ncbi:LANO_0G05006g1_1 [Lachancea nothofagi CBS 11611]|uniref:LANO_0G05006g1_1 n=1 Tax=Lachancea nothofagi CBS 11611 TaxID=1266666 RepID=A0A1G4KGH1_9SACH|nr:LANO_0G05006g1_1 [Lachancea nothofagi CBS 11611]